jgi:hypothetical protein
MAPISEDRVRNIQKRADEKAKAFVESSQHLETLWRARLNLALALDDEAAVKDALSQGETGLWDTNTNCSGCGGGGGSKW